MDLGFVRVGNPDVGNTSWSLEGLTSSSCGYILALHSCACEVISKLVVFSSEGNGMVHFSCSKLNLIKV